MTTTDTAVEQVSELMRHLDEHLDDVCGYNLDVIHYDFHGHRELRAQIFPKTLEQAQRAADATGVRFTRNPDNEIDYNGWRNGVKYGFLLAKDLPEYPEAIDPRTGGAR